MVSLLEENLWEISRYFMSVEIFDNGLTFEEIYNKEYFPSNAQGIENANVLILPNESFRNRQGLFFVESLEEIYIFLKDFNYIHVEIATDDELIQKTELH